MLRYRSRALLRLVETLTRLEKFDVIVCDFLSSAANIPDLSSVVLFQHNVESMIWKRHTEHAGSAWHRAYSRGQYERMLRYEADVCRSAKKIIAVSSADASAMNSLYGATGVCSVPTGVNLEYFAPPLARTPTQDLVFLGAMDWRPNIDGLSWFVGNVLPLIRARRPGCSLTVVGRAPTAEVRRLAESDKHIHVTGTVDDVRPYLWESGAAIVPLRIGGGTRLKIYEAMAAKIPVVSTSVGAEGLDIRDGDNIAIADSPQEFAERCVALLDDSGARQRMAANAWETIAACYSWEVVSSKFEQLLA
jgi:glycosyltransferase involved in cell wall biosynthesis